MRSRISMRARLAFDREHRRAGHRRGERLRAAHAAQPGRQDPLAREVAAEVLPAGLGERLVGALHDALAADVDPRAGRHLAVHHEPLAVELVEVLPGRPVRHEVRVGEQHARRVGVRAGTRRPACPTGSAASRRRSSRAARRRSRRSTPSCARRGRCRRRRRARCGFSATSGSRLFISIRSARLGQPALRACARCRAARAPRGRNAARRCDGGCCRRGSSRSSGNAAGGERRKSPRSTRDAAASRSGANARSRSQAARRRGSRPSPPRASATSRAARGTRCPAPRRAARSRRCARCSPPSAQPARGERRHADVVLLIGRGRQRIDRGRMGERLVLRRQRRRGHVRDHEAGVDAAVLDEERRQARRAPGRSSARCAAPTARRSRRSPAPGSRPRTPPARRGSCRRRGSRRRRRTPAGCRRRALASVSEHARRVTHLVDAGAHHLRLAAQAVGILHARSQSGATRGSRCQPAGRDRRAAASIWPRWPRSGMDARIERRVAAEARVDRHRAGDERGREQRARPRRVPPAPARSRPACR